VQTKQLKSSKYPIVNISETSQILICEIHQYILCDIAVGSQGIFTTVTEISFGRKTRGYHRIHCYFQHQIFGLWTQWLYTAIWRWADFVQGHHTLHSEAKYPALEITVDPMISSGFSAKWYFSDSGEYSLTPHSYITENILADFTDKDSASFWYIHYGIFWWF